MNDACCLIVGELKMLFRLSQREGTAGRQVLEGSWTVWEKVELKLARLQGGQVK